MKGFLNIVSDDIISQYQGDLSNVLVLFPNRRPIRFFVQSIKDNENISLPCFVPQMMSISDLVSNYVFDYKQAENIQLMYILYQVYSEVYYKANPPKDEQDKENFSDFYHWGDMLLNDFDEIDKSLVEAKIFYRNLNDYKDLQQDPVKILSEDTIKLINRLFNAQLSKESSEDKSFIRDNFVKLWNCLYDIYERFNQELDQLHLAYGGKMERLFASRLENKELTIEQDNIKVVGFSVLNACEKKIFSLLKENYQTDFYWDYDDYYKDDSNNEAGIFVNENLRLFSQSETFAKNNFNNILTDNKHINIVTAPYETSCLAYIGSWLDEVVPLCEKGGLSLNNIAIILNDESLAPLVLKAIPDRYIDKLNITMGFPFIQSWLFSDVLKAIENLIDQEGFNSQGVFETIKSIVDKLTDKDDKKLWQIKVLQKVSQSIIPLTDTISKIGLSVPKIIIEKSVIKDVVKKTLSKLNVDIISEGISNIQLMGMLETRLLDFDYVLMVSASDDNLPNISNNRSLIPNAFKKAYKLNDIDRKTGVFAYYFYRLLHHIKRIDYLFTNLNATDKVKEMSRFIRQITIELPKQNDKITIDFKSIMAGNALKTLSRDYKFDINDMKFIDKGQQSLAPSNINKLIHCEQRFFLSKVKYLKMQEKDNNYLNLAFGNIFHGSISMLYNAIEKRQTDVLQARCSDEELEQIISQSVAIYLQSEQVQREREICSDYIHLSMIKEYMKQVFRLDEKEQNIYLGGEITLKKDITIGKHIVHLEGRLDKLDLIKEPSSDYYTVRILDYKTGTSPSDLKINSLDDIFKNPLKMVGSKEVVQPRKRGRDNIFEILMYSYLVYNNWSEINKLLQEKLDKTSVAFNIDRTKIKPELMYLSKRSERNIEMAGSGVIYFDSEFNKLFEQYLTNLLCNFLDKEQGEMYNKNINDDMCKRCDYALLCKLGQQKK